MFSRRLEKSAKSRIVNRTSDDNPNAGTVIAAGDRGVVVAVAVVVAIGNAGVGAVIATIGESTNERSKFDVRAVVVAVVAVIGKAAMEAVIGSVAVAICEASSSNGGNSDAGADDGAVVVAVAVAIDEAILSVCGNPDAEAIIAAGFVG